MQGGRPDKPPVTEPLRHLHATLLLKAGVPVHGVASRLGHSDPAITLRVYAHVLDDQASQAVTVFERLVQKRAIPESQASVAGTCTVGPWPV